jgi:hypothetical protein
VPASVMLVSLTSRVAVLLFVLSEVEVEVGLASFFTQAEKAQPRIRQIRVEKGGSFFIFSL